MSCQVFAPQPPLPVSDNVHNTNLNHAYCAFYDSQEQEQQQYYNYNSDQSSPCSSFNSAVTSPVSDTSANYNHSSQSLEKMEFGHNQSAPDEKVTNIIGESKDVDDEDGSKRTEYLSANCVLVTYFSGKDAAKVVDEHFNRALHKEEEEETADEKHPLHAPPTGGTRRSSSSSPLPLAQRNLPASFWISDFHHIYHQNRVRHHNQTASTTPSTSQSSSSLLSHFGHDFYGYSDPWQNYMMAASAYPHHHHQYSHHPHQVGHYSHGSAATARLNPSQYSSLFLAQQTDSKGDTSSWNQSSHNPGHHQHHGGQDGGGGYAAAAAASAHYGFDGQSASKNLYWF